MLDDLDGAGHRLYLGEQLVLLPVPLLEEVFNAQLVRESGTVVVDVLDGFPLDWNVGD